VTATDRSWLLRPSPARHRIASAGLAAAAAAVALGGSAWLSIWTVDVGHPVPRTLVVMLWMAALLVQPRLSWSPALVPLVLGAEAFLLGGYPDEVRFPFLLTLASAGLLGAGTAGRTTIVAAAAWPLGATLSYVREYPFPSLLGDLAWTTAFGWSALAVGIAVRSSRRRREDVAGAATEREHGLLAERADVTAAERARIAAELHDLIIHNVSQMQVQAGAAQTLLLAGEAERARTPLRAVEETGATTLAELRRVLGVLRQDPPGSPPDPLPGLHGLDALAHRARRDGLDVRVALLAAPDLAPATGLTAFRVVEHGLAQARSAGARHAEVEVRPDGDAVTVRVRHDGGPAVRGSLDAVRDRVLLHGGQCTVRQDGTGQQVLCARLPTVRGAR
jgi:signal transduction histidine kinase